jgi:hypothetical protein
MSRCSTNFFKPLYIVYGGVTTMEPKLILYEDLKKDYHHLLFSSDLRFAGQYNNLTPSVTQGSKRQPCMWTHVSSLREAGWKSSALVPVQRRVSTCSLLLTAASLSPQSQVNAYIISAELLFFSEPCGPFFIKRKRSM